MRNDFSFSYFSLFSEASTINSRAEDVFWMKIENKHRKAKFIHLFQIISTKIKKLFFVNPCFSFLNSILFWTLMYADVFKFDATNVKTMREFNMTCWCLAKILRKYKGLWKRKITLDNDNFVSLFCWSCWWAWVWVWKKMAENYSQATNPFSAGDISTHVTNTQCMIQQIQN